jgi:hypothetical protein
MSERSHASVWHLLSEFYARRDAGKLGQADHRDHSRITATGTLSGE